jgi:uncharacterized protein with FMN-binding domain
MARKKAQVENNAELQEEVEAPQVSYHNVAYTIVSSGDKYNLVEVKFNAKEQKLGSVNVLSTDDRYQIEEELMLKIEDMLYDV